MSNVEAATKAAEQLIKRLFDHRQFTSGEINYVRQQGEAVDLDDSFRNLLKINEDVCMISDATNNVLRNSEDQFARELLERVSSLNERAAKLLKLEEEFKAKAATSIEEVRKEREMKRQEELICIKKIMDGHQEDASELELTSEQK